MKKLSKPAPRTLVYIPQLQTQSELFSIFLAVKIGVQ